MLAQKLARLLPPSIRRRVVLWLGILTQPPLSQVGFGDLRRLAPIRRDFGWMRGLPVDRHYIERFLSAHASEIQGHVMEIGDNYYTRKFGRDRVTRSDVLHVVEGNPNATIVADLTRADHLPSDTFDCIILTQTLQCIYDVRTALGTLHRILKPNGVLLATCHGISHLSRDEMDLWGEYWRFTDRSVRRLFAEFFPPNGLEVKQHGNVLASIAFLHGLAAEELSADELDYVDPDFQVIITVRATKGAE